MQACIGARSESVQVVGKEAFDLVAFIRVSSTLRHKDMLMHLIILQYGVPLIGKIFNRDSLTHIKAIISARDPLPTLHADGRYPITLKNHEAMIIEQPIEQPNANIYLCVLGRVSKANVNV